MKHENRIRALEARIPAQQTDEEDDKESTKMKADNEEETEIGPDEV